MTEKVYSLDTKPGIQRDGTVFDKQFYNDGRWVRFQRGRPRKIGGYRVISNQLSGPSRGIWVDAKNGFNGIFSGYADGLQRLDVDNNGVGSGYTNITLSNFTPSPLNLWQFDGFYDVGGAGVASLVAHPSQDLLQIDNTTNTPVLIGNVSGNTMSKIGVFTASFSTINGSPYLTRQNTNTLIGGGQKVTGTGIPANTTVVSTELDAPQLSSPAITGTAGQMSCTSTPGLFVNQSVTVTGNPTPVTLSSVAITGSGGTFSCTSSAGLSVGQAVYVSGSPTTQSLASVAITGTEGTFSCTATTGLYVGMPVRVTGTQTPATLASVQVTGTAGQCTCTATNGLYIGQPVLVTGTLTGTATGVAGNQVYYIIATDGTSSFTLSSAPDGTAITTTAGTTTGLTFKATLFSGVDSDTTYYITATNTTSTFTLSKTQNGPSITTINVALTGLVFTAYNTTGVYSGRTYYIIATNGSTTFTLSSVLNGEAITDTYGVTTGLTFKTVPDCGIDTNTTYYIIATNGTTTFTLSATEGGSAITTVVGSIAGLIFTLGLYQKVTISNNATVTGTNTLTFDNQVEVSGGVVVLHPYIFVYGNNGLIRNCSAGNAQDWVSADANEVNVATGKIVQGLPVRGGSNSPSGLFWSLDSLVRVSYAPQSLGVAGTSNFSTPTFWRYDIISSQSSILSSQSVIEYDGIYYWCGVDRFLMYNGVVKEIPNPMNQNFFFDNLNYSQRQKVWATKVPRYGEIWWFYPRGDSTECNDAIIYNIRENTWYDAGTAIGARRSAGYFSQVFSYPIMAGWETSVSEEISSGSYALTSGSPILLSNTYNSDIYTGLMVEGTGIPADTNILTITSSGIKTLTNLVGGSGYTNGTYTNVPIIFGSGFGAEATIVVSGNAVTSVTITTTGNTFQVGDTVSADKDDIGGTGAGFTIDVSAIWAQIITMSKNATSTSTETITFKTQSGLIDLWQHEYGVDEVRGQDQNAIESYIETSDLGWVAGGPSEPAMTGMNKWVRIERIEPDFIQSGEMEVYVTGRPYADEQDATSQAYAFQPGTGKIDMREQRRELRIKFRSDVQGGDYQMGRVLISADIGDVRGYSGS